MGIVVSFLFTDFQEVGQEILEKWAVVSESQFSVCSIRYQLGQFGFGHFEVMRFEADLLRDILPGGRIENGHLSVVGSAGSNPQFGDGVTVPSCGFGPFLLFHKNRLLVRPLVRRSKPPRQGGSQKEA